MNRGGDGMRRKRISIDAVCPFYCSEDTHKIRCEGVEDESATHLVFSTLQGKKDHQRKYCNRKYKECLWAKALYMKYGGDDDD